MISCYDSLEQNLEIKIPNPIQKHPFHRPFPVIQHILLTSGSQTTAQDMNTLSLGSLSVLQLPLPHFPSS